MNLRELVAATAIGTVAQIAMVLIGHYVPSFRGVYMWGGLGLSLVAGFLYARAAGDGWLMALLGGLAAGAICAALGILVSWLLGDVPAKLILLGTTGSAVFGVLGAVAGKLIARG